MVSSTPRQHFTPAKDPVPIYRRMGGSQGRLGRAENLVPTGIRSQIAQSVAQSLYRLSYTAHIYIYIYIYIVRYSIFFYCKIYPVVVHRMKLEPELILLVLAIHATCFGSTGLPQAFKYMIFKTQHRQRHHIQTGAIVNYF